ncbi:MAG TPA: DUF4173 domain-containing protein [Thermoanaerobaculia bacterium]|nr:DUF4173 domain-containing protein [Thermoanaerobaculia bacterium]
MNKHRFALTLALSALLLGLAGDLLLRWIPWGLNVPLWVALAVAVAVHGTAGTERRVALFPAVCALLSAAGLVWRDAELLRVLDVALLLFFLPMLALRVRGVQLGRAGLSEVGLAVAATGAQTVAGVPRLVFSDIPWRELPARGTMRAGGVAARGLVLASPALVVFAALLMSADAAFAKLIQNLFLFDVPDAATHLIVTIVLGAACAGFLRSLLLSGAMPRVPRPSFVKLPAAETSVALALVNLLFAAFVLVQFRYFFLITNPASLARYARRGFFELVLVVALVLPMLLLLDWLVEKKSKLFRALIGAQVALVLVIAASAMRRMQLYRDAFGLTELRLYTTAFMVFLSVLLLWLVATVLTGNRHRFAAGAIATGMIAVLALHAINPDAFIATTNIARARAGLRVLDARYVAHLSDDAAPVILANRDAFAAQPEALWRFLAKPRTIGWRTWNVSRARAIRELRLYESNASGR